MWCQIMKANVAQINKGPVRLSGSFQAGPESAAEKSLLSNHDRQDPRRVHKGDIGEGLVPMGEISINCT